MRPPPKITICQHPAVSWPEQKEDVLSFSKGLYAKSLLALRQALGKRPTQEDSNMIDGSSTDGWQFDDITGE